MRVWSLRSPRSAIASCKPRRARGVVPVQTQSSENQGCQWSQSQPASENLRTKSADVQGQEKMGISALFRPSRKDWVMPPLMVRPIFFPHLLTHMLMSSWNTLTGTPINDVLPTVWASLCPVKLMHKNISINKYPKTSCGTFQNQRTGIQKIKLILTIKSIQKNPTGHSIKMGTRH